MLKRNISILICSLVCSLATGSFGNTPVAGSPGPWGLPPDGKKYVVEAKVLNMKNVPQKKQFSFALLSVDIVRSIPKGLEGEREMSSLDTFYVDDQDGKVMRLTTNNAWAFPGAAYLMIVDWDGEDRARRTHTEYMKYPLIEWTAIIKAVPDGDAAERMVVKEPPPKMPTVEQLANGIQHDDLSFGRKEALGPYDEVVKTLTARYAERSRWRGRPSLPQPRSGNRSRD